MRYGVIGDVHLGFKAYDSDLRTRETLDTFEQIIRDLSDVPLILIQELFDDTVVPNWIKKELIRIKEEHRDQRWLILGGNHDSTKTYSSVSVLDAFAEIHNVHVVNKHVPETVEICGVKTLCVPHMRSQKEFLDWLDRQDGQWDAAMLHCMVNSKLDLGPNDLNIDMKRLEKLSRMCKHVWLGHEHNPWKPLANAHMCGSILEFDFGQLGPKFVYWVEDTVVRQINVVPPRRMIQLEQDWCGPVKAMETLQKLDPGNIYKVIFNGIPVEESSTAANTANLFEAQFNGTVIFDLRKTGHRELKVTEIDASLNIMEEFEVFAESNNLGELELEMRGRLEDAISQTILEDEEAAC